MMQHTALPDSGRFAVSEASPGGSGEVTVQRPARALSSHPAMEIKISIAAMAEA
jgi:hypothetical protein